MTTSQEQLDAMLNAFQAAHKTSQADPGAKLRELINTTPGLKTAFLDQIDKGHLVEFAQENSKALGSYDRTRKVMFVRVDNLIAAADGDKAMEDSLRCTLGHEINHAQNSEATASRDQALTNDVRGIVSGSWPHDYTATVAAYNQSNRSLEVHAEIAGFNALAGYVKSHNPKATLKDLYEASSDIMASYIDRGFSKGSITYTLKPGLTLDANLEMPPTQANIDAMGKYFYDARGYPKDAVNGALTYIKTVEDRAQKVAQSVGPQPFVPQVHIDLQALGTPNATLPDRFTGTSAQPKPSPQAAPPDAPDAPLADRVRTLSQEPLARQAREQAAVHGGDVIEQGQRAQRLQDMARVTPSATAEPVLPTHEARVTPSPYPGGMSFEEAHRRRDEPEDISPRSLQSVHRLKTPDPLYDLQLARLTQIANENAEREYGSLSVWRAQQEQEREQAQRQTQEKVQEKTQERTPTHASPQTPSQAQAREPASLAMATPARPEETAQASDVPPGMAEPAPPLQTRLASQPGPVEPVAALSERTMQPSAPTATPEPRGLAQPPVETPAQPLRESTPAMATPMQTSASASVLPPEAADPAALLAEFSQMRHEMAQMKQQIAQGQFAQGQPAQSMQASPAAAREADERKAPGQGQQGPAIRLLSDPAHPDYAMFQRARSELQQFELKQGRRPDAEKLDNMAGALVVAARAEGITRIEHAVPGDAGEHFFVAQGDLKSPFKVVAGVTLQEAAQTPLAQSSAQWSQVVQANEQTQAQQREQSQQNQLQAQQTGFGR